MNEAKPVVNTNVYSTVRVSNEWLNIAVVAYINDAKPVVNTKVYNSVRVLKQWLNTTILSYIETIRSLSVYTSVY